MWTETGKFDPDHAGKRCTSHTEIMVAAECPMKHFKQYVERNKSYSHHMFYGSALDDVFTRRVKYRKQGRTPPTLQEAQDEFLGLYTAKCEKSESVDHEAEEVTKLNDTGPKHVELFVREVEPLLRPLEAQFRFYMPIITLNPNDPLYIRGDLDYVDERKFFIDWKTMKSTPSLNWAHRKAYAKEHGLIEDKAFKAKWKAEHPDDTIISAKYFMQLRTYWHGLNHCGLNGWDSGYLFNFIKELKVPKIVKQQVKFMDPDFDLIAWKETIVPICHIIEANYKKVTADSQTPLRLGKFFESPYNVSACDMCDQKDFGGLWGPCH